VAEAIRPTPVDSELTVVTDEGELPVQTYFKDEEASGTAAIDDPSKPKHALEEKAAGAVSRASCQQGRSSVRRLEPGQLAAQLRSLRRLPCSPMYR